MLNLTDYPRVGGRTRTHPMLRAAAKAFWCATLLISTGAPSIGLAEQLRCTDAPAKVTAGAETDRSAACAAAHAAFTFMREHGFDTIPEVRIRVVDALDDPAHPQSYGQFKATSMEIDVLSHEASKSQGRNGLTPFGLPMRGDLYRSYVVHEIAHAIAHANFRIDDPSVEAHEYIAYTVQLATMPGALRDQILQRHSVAAFADDGEISRVYLAIDPARFAVKAYRHFLKPQNGTAFYTRLLGGSFRPAAPY